MSEFNAKRARAKRPCPLWIDAFQRDTQHLAADEVGAYILILMAMWTRENCDFPDDDSRLAKVCRVSVRLWKSRLSEVIRPFFTTEGGALISKRLRQEAAYVEVALTKQSDRRRAEKDEVGASQNASHTESRENDENSDNPLKNNHPTSSADQPPNDPRHHPSQQPNNPREDKKGRDKPSPRGAVHPANEIAEAVMAFNAAADRAGWQRVAKMTESRKQKLAKRLSDAGGIDGWHAALAKAEASDLCCGRKTDWKASFDFLLQESSFVKLMEGNYDNRSGGGGSHGGVARLTSSGRGGPPPSLASIVAERRARREG